MERFHIIDDGAVILRSKGNYRQAKVYQRGGHVYGGWAGGYVRLLQGSGTSNPNVGWLEIEADGVTIARNGAPVYGAPALAVA